MDAAESNPPLPPKLGAADVASLAAGVAELAKAGLPLPAGLRALAAELPGWRAPLVLREMAARLERGDAIEAVLDYSAGSLPPHVHGLLVAGLRSGRLPEVLEEYVEVEEKQCRIRRQLRLSLAYPIFLVAFLTLLVFFFNFGLVSTFVKIFRDFGTALPAMTMVFIATFKFLPWISLGFLAFMVLVPFLLSDAPGVGWFCPIAYCTPMVGKLLKYSRWAVFSRYTAILLGSQTPLPDALRLIAGGLADPYLAGACRESADRVEQGDSLSTAMERTGWFPRSLLPFIRWGEKTNALPDAFRSASEMYEGRVESQTASLMAIFLPIVFFAIMFLAGWTVLSIFLPLVSLITSLTSGHK